MTCDPLALADWRRHTFELYAVLRAAPSPEDGWTLWRRSRDALYQSHPCSPLPAGQRAAYPGVPVFDYDPALRFSVEIAPIENEPEEVVEVGEGQMRLRPVGRTTGLSEALGAELTLFWIGGYGGGLFLPFKDATNGSETYGGGRYLLDAIKGADLGRGPDGATILDFNFTYAPSCAHNADYICPLSPPENRLPALVRGGEKLLA